MKIAYIIARYAPFPGGAEIYTQALAERMAAAGHDVTVLTTDDQPERTMAKLPRQEKLNGVNVIRLRNWTRGQLNLGFYPALLGKLWRNEYDVVHVGNGPGFIWRDLCITIAQIGNKLRGRKTKFITTPHGPFLATPETHSGLKRGLAKIAQVIMAPYLKLWWPRLWDLVLADNTQQPEWLIRDYWVQPSKIQLVPVGISADLIYAGDFQSLWDKKQAHPVTISYIGRIAKYKGVQDVIAALEKAEEFAGQGLNFRFVIMGRLEYTEIKELIARSTIADKIELLETPSDHVKNAVLEEASQIIILPSQWEAFGIVLAEGMAKGNIPITTTGNEAAELLIENNRTGFIYEFGDIDRLARIFQQLILGQQLRRGMSELNLELAKKLTWDASFAAYSKLLN
jgi:glycosyltransferase involved in cell wall biosynthesis